MRDGRTEVSTFRVWLVILLGAMPRAIARRRQARVARLAVVGSGAHLAECEAIWARGTAHAPRT